MILINEQQIRARIPASANVEMSLLRPNIILYQETRLEEILGSSFYADIVTKYGNQTLSVAEQFLLTNYIHPVISYGGLNISIPFLYAQISNRGIVQQSGDFTTTALDSAFRQLRDSVKTSLDNYEAKLLKYLKLNRGTFPLYSYIDTDVVNPEVQSPNDFGMVLDFFGGSCDEIELGGCGCGSSGTCVCSTPTKNYANAWDYTSGEITTMTASNTYYKLNSNMTSPFSVGFTFSNESLIYTSATPSVIELTGIASLKCGNNNDIEVAYFINGNLYPCSQQETTATNNKPVVIPFHCVANLNQNDIVEVYVRNITSTTDIELYHINIILKEIV